MESGDGQMEFVRIAGTSELIPGQMKRVQVEGQDILLANVDGHYYAIADRCTHLGGSLCEGSLASAVVACPKHGARFDVRTGEALSGAKVLFFEEAVRNTVRFEVLVDGAQVFVGVSA
jgi:3-phenylpropionate/trans-cinnamate dioxygenase ferredoxin subunit